MQLVKRTLVLLLLTLCSPSLSWALPGCPIHSEQGFDSDGGTSSGVNTTAISPHGVLVVVETYLTSGPSAPSDNQSNTFTPLAETCFSGTTYCTRISYKIDPTTNATHTFTTTATYSTVLILGCNADNVVAYDPTVTGAAAGPTTSTQPGAQTPDNNDSLIVTGVVTSDGNVTNITINSGFTAYTHADSPSAYFDSALGWKILATAASTNPTWSWTTSDYSTTSMAVFSGFGAGAGGARPCNILLLGVC